MTLGFSTKINGKQNYFVEKIWRGFYDLNPQAVNNTITDYLNKGYVFSNIVDQLPKIHTIRKGNRWKGGNKIHFVVNNRTKNRFQFAPIIKCTGVQEIEIKYNNKCSDLPTVIIDNKSYNVYETGHFDVLNRLAKNDGFESIEDFFKYFNGDFKGQIVHWTNLRY